MPVSFTPTCKHDNQSNTFLQNLHGPEIAATICDDCGKVLWREDQWHEDPRSSGTPEEREP